MPAPQKPSPRSASRAAGLFSFVTPLLAALASSAALLAPPAAQAATETRSVPAFQALTLSAGMNVTLRQGPQQLLTLTADDSVLAQLETVVDAGKDGGTLVLRYKRGSHDHADHKLQATVVVPRLSAVRIAGSGDVRIETFNTPALKLAIAGSGDIQVQGLTADDLQVSVAGSGNVRGTGQARRLKVSVAGSGDVRLPDLRADDVTVGIAGSGDVTVQAQTTLDVSIVGSGDVTYSGAAKLKQSVRGSGRIQQR